jgi:hypothetical protein
MSRQMVLPPDWSRKSKREIFQHLASGTLEAVVVDGNELVVLPATREPLEQRVRVLVQREAHEKTL